MAETPQDRDKKKHCIQLSMWLRKTTDADIIAHLSTQENKAGYIKALIRADIAKKEKNK